MEHVLETCPKRNGIHKIKSRSPRTHGLATSRYHCLAESRLTIANDLFVFERAGKTTVFLVPMRNVLIGFALSSEEAYCADVSLSEFISLCLSVVLPVKDASDRRFALRVKG